MLWARARESWNRDRYMEGQNLYRHHRRRHVALYLHPASRPEIRKSELQNITSMG